MCRPFHIFILGYLAPESSSKRHSACVGRDEESSVLICAVLVLATQRMDALDRALTGQLSQVQPVPQLQEPELEHPQLPILMNLLGLQLVWWFG
jgi:hypothetical protein